MTRVDTLLPRWETRHDMRDKLMAGEAKRNRLFRSPSDDTAEAVDIEPERGFDIVNREGQMEQIMPH